MLCLAETTETIHVLLSSVRRDSQLQQQPAAAMPSDFKHWFNSSAHADTLLRIHLQRHPVDDAVPSADTASGPDGTTIQAQQALTDGGSGPDSKEGSLTEHSPVRTYHAHAIILSTQSAYFAASLGNNWQRLRLQLRQHQQQVQQQGVQERVPDCPNEMSEEGTSEISIHSNSTGLGKAWRWLGCTARTATVLLAALLVTSAWRAAAATLIAGTVAAMAMAAVTGATMAGVAVAATASGMVITALLALVMAAAMAAAPTTTGAPGAGVAGGVPAVPIDVTLQPDELDAMDLMLHFMYGFDLPAVSPQTTPTLIHCLLLADRFDVPNCVDALLTHIKGTAASAEFFCVAPPGITSRPEFKALLELSQRTVVDTYGDVPAVIRSKRLTRGFCALPFKAVLAWAKSDELRVQSENCVVYLLSAWVKRQTVVWWGGRGVTAYQLEQLAQQVRVLHLGPAYQHHILPRLGWFKGCSGMAHLPTLLAFKGKDAAGRAVFPADGVQFPAEFRKYPPKWVADARQQSRVTDSDKVLRWEVVCAWIMNVDVGRYSPPLYVNGFMLRIQLLGRVTCDSSRATLRLHIGADIRQAGGAISWPHTAAVSVGAVDLRVLRGSGEGVSRRLSDMILLGTTCWDYTCMLSGQGPDLYNLVAPYLKDGKLHVEARFTTVDNA